MRQIEPSLTSMGSVSTEAMQGGYKRQLVQGKVGFFDGLFSLFDQLSTGVKINSFFYTFSALIFYSQVFITSIWSNNKFWEEKHIESEIRSIWGYFMLFNRNMSDSSVIIWGVSISLLAFMSLVFLYSVHDSFSLNRKKASWIMYLTRFIFEILSIILIHPFAALLGEAFTRFFRTNSKTMLVGFICSLIGYSCVLLHTYISLFLFSRSICIVVSPLSMFQPHFLMFLSVLSSGTIIFDSFFSMFPAWSGTILQLLHASAMLYFIIQLRFFPFHKFGTCLLAIFIVMLSLFSDIFCIFMSYQSSISFSVGLIGIGLLFAIVYFFTYKVFQSRWNSVVESLNKEITPDDQFDELFISLGIDKSIDRAFMYLRIGLINHSKIFLNWTLMKFIGQHFVSTSTHCQCIQMLSFFPSEIRLMNYFYSWAISRTDFTFEDRFLVFQVNRIKTQRQTISSQDANERLLQLKASSMQCEIYMRSFWSQTEVLIDNLEGINKNIESVNSQWEEAIRDYPNNSKFYEEYCRFLTEVTCDFQKAIFQRHQSEILDMSRARNIDNSFRSFVNAYPRYIKDKILDIRGNFVSKNTSKGSVSSGELITFTSSSTEESHLEADIEEMIGKRIFSQPKMRIALDRALKGRKPNSVQFLVFSAIFVILIVVSLFAFLFISFSADFDSRRVSLSRINYLMKSRFYSSLSGFYVFLNFANKTNKYAIGKLPSQMMFPYDRLTLKWMVNGNDNFASLMNNVALYARTSDSSVFKMASLLIENGTKIQYCANGRVISSRYTDLSTVYTYSSFLQGQIATSLDVSDMLNSSFYCELIKSWDSIVDASSILIDKFAEEQNNEYTNLDQRVTTFLLFVSISVFVLLMIPTASGTIVFLHETKRLGGVLLAFDEAQKNSCKTPIMLGIDSDNSNHAINPSGPLGLCSKFLMIVILIIIVDLFLVLLVTQSKSANNTIYKLNQWQYYASWRLPFVVESLYHSMIALILNETNMSQFLDRSYHINKALESLSMLEFHNNQLFQGNGTMEPISGFDSLLDEYNVQEKCSNNTIGAQYDDLYKCASLNQAIGVYSLILQELLKVPDLQNGRIDSKESIHAITIANNYLWDRLEKTLTRLEALAFQTDDNMMTIFLIIAFCDLLVAFLMSIFSLRISHSFQSLYNVLLSLVRRIPPIEIVNNSELLDILMNRDNTKKQMEISLAGRIIMNSHEAIICTGQNGVIELVNPFVTKLLGYTPEQLLGQSVSIILSQNDTEKVLNQIKLMKDGHSSHFYEDHISCLSDNAQEVPCEVTVLGMGKIESRAQSFVLILRDETQLKVMRKEAEESKQQSESLLYQILPRDIVLRINRGEKEISFSIASASVVFIEIMKIQEFLSTLSPSEVMGTLSHVFSTFDEILKKYKSITKIKLIGDVYMAASGLFSELSHKESSEELVKFGIDAISEMDDINIKLNTNLSVRIGINSGGPILAGVLGTDKPLFDIIGDPINVASRLESTSLPGRIQISQETYDLISDSGFDIEKRGEVFLKGKGQTITYFVNSNHNYYAHISSLELKSSESNV